VRDIKNLSNRDNELLLRSREGKKRCKIIIIIIIEDKASERKQQVDQAAAVSRSNANEITARKLREDHKSGNFMH